MSDGQHDSAGSVGQQQVFFVLVLILSKVIIVKFRAVRNVSEIILPTRKIEFESCK